MIYLICFFDWLFELLLVVCDVVVSVVCNMCGMDVMLFDLVDLFVDGVVVFGLKGVNIFVDDLVIWGDRLIDD